MTKEQGLTNKLFYGDNLPTMRDYIPDGSVDLVYLDPPFDSKRRYCVTFKDKAGFAPVVVQIAAFDDCWRWTKETDRTYTELLRDAPGSLPVVLEALLASCGQNMAAYLVSMSIRLLELHRVLKPTGSIYLHCDPTTSHYLKIVMDSIFGARNFRNEVIWHYITSPSPKTRFGQKHDVLLFYAKSKSMLFNADAVRVPHSPRTRKVNVWKRGDKTYTCKRNPLGKTCPDVWDIPTIGATARERLGYPTQKPERLLERVIKASSRPGDIVLDPFSGAGTTVAVAEKLGRRWIGIDITPLAVAMTERRLEGAFPGCQFEVVGDSPELAAARTQIPSEEEHTQERLF